MYLERRMAAAPPQAAVAPPRPAAPAAPREVAPAAEMCIRDRSGNTQERHQGPGRNDNSGDSNLDSAHR